MGGSPIVGLVDGMSPLVGGYHVAAVVLVASGVAKVIAPHGFDTVLKGLLKGLSSRPSPRVPWGTGRVVGLVEIGLGVVAIAMGTAAVALSLALAYVAFAGVVVLARRRGLASCGCFGETTAPPSTIHVVVNLASAVIVGMVALDPPGSLGRVLSAQPMAGVPYVVGVGVAAWLVVLLTTRGAVVASLVASAESSRAETRRRLASGSR